MNNSQISTSVQLRTLLSEIDHKSYPMYKRLQGSWRFSEYILDIVHVQGDPFAAPSSVDVRIDARTAGFPADLLTDPARPETRRSSIALADELLRRFHRALTASSHQAHGSGKSGALFCTDPGQEVLERGACAFDEKGNLTVRFLIGFPAAGRTILAGELEKILFDLLPKCVHENLLYRSLPASRLREVVDLQEDQVCLRSCMKKAGLIAFVADGAVLPRESGISQRPMREAVAFRSPGEDRVRFHLPHAGQISGMGLRPGITLIIGGGYHGKSTLLEALERGVYDHIRGDGREFVMSDETVMKVRAEDGRAIRNVDISPFIRDLPNGADTVHFSSENASGSTSQAAAVVESIESGARVLLMDEDTCATNFMVRDDLMGRIVDQKDEPIVPYSSRMRALFESRGISTILVAGSSGAFFPEADTVIRMDRYQPFDVTKRVQEVLAEEAADTAEDDEKGTVPELHFPELHFEQRKLKADRKVLSAPARVPYRGTKPGGERDRFRTDGRRYGRGGAENDGAPSEGRPEEAGDVRSAKRKNLGRDGFMIGHETVDLRALAQVVDGEQTEFLSCAVMKLAEQMDGSRSLQSLVGELAQRLEREGISALFGRKIPGNVAVARVQEVYAALNRCRFVR